MQLSRPFTSAHGRCDACTITMERRVLSSRRRCLLSGGSCHGVGSILDHPDKAGLLALKGSICGSNCSALASWNDTSQVCSQLGFEGVYCAWVNGAWRAVSVHLQLEVSTVAFNDSALTAGGNLQGIQYLRELEILCYRDVVLGLWAEAPHDEQAVFAVSPSLSAAAAASNSYAHSWGVQQQAQPAALQQAGMLYSNSSLTSDSQLRASINTNNSSLCNSDASAQHVMPAADTAGIPDTSAPPAALGELPRNWFLAYPFLQQLRVTACGARGKLPAELLSVKQLSSLVLSRNKIAGTLPQQLVLLQHLTLLDLSSNQLSGTLPAAWSALPQLSYLYLNQNNLTLDVLPCEWASMLSLRLADLSGNKYRPSGIGTAATAAAAGKPCWAGRRIAASSNTGDHSSKQLGTSTSRGRRYSSALKRSSHSGILRGPRCWLSQFCYNEGVFICLQRSSKHPGGGCTSYIYGSSDLHTDPLNQCDHGGSHFVAVAALWTALLAALLLIYLHHCRLLRRLTDPPERRKRQQQQWQGEPYQRQWLVTTGPAASPRAVPSAATAGNEATLPLLYYPASSQQDGAGYVRPASPGASSLADSERFLPSALNTPPVTTTRLMVVRGLGSGADSGYDYDSDHDGSGLGYNMQPGRSRLGSLATGAGPFSPRLAGAGADDSSRSCFSSELLLPLAFAVFDATTDVRLLVLWGIWWPQEIKLWPSYTLLGLILMPHVLVGAVVHFRLLAAACLPPAVQAASATVETDILPPGSRCIIMLYSWLFSAPWWLAYPLILLLLAPGIALLAALCPLTLLLHAFAVSSHEAVVRYVQLMQGCIALTEAPCTAVLLTALFLMGNTPLEYAFLDGSLFYLNLVASMIDMGVAWWIKLEGIRRQQIMQLAQTLIAPAGIWS